MTSKHFELKASSVPKDPGVYLFKDENGKIIYVGKAKNLRSRVRSYFSNAPKPAKTQQLVSRTSSLDWIVVDNEVEALLLENKMVKQHQPRYNISLKDSKTFAYISFTREAFPRVLTSRRVSPKMESYGPYTDAVMRRDLQRLVTKVFKIRTCRTLPKRACLNLHISVCTAPCVGNVTEEQYRKQVEQARSFLKGNYNQTTQELAAQMDAAAKEQKYELALELRNQIASIQLLTQRQIVDRERRFDQDVVAFKRFGEKVLAVQMGIRKGVLLGKTQFTVDLQPQVEQEFLKAFYTANPIPREILLNKTCWTDLQERTALEEFFSAKRGAPVNLTIPGSGDKLALVKLAEKNIESNVDAALVDLQAVLNLPTIPRVIECFDVSNLGQEHAVSGMVRFTDAKPDKKNYRKFKIKTVTGQDDFASINEAVTRRYKRLTEENAPMPDLVVVDGGLGQVSAAKTALQSLGLQIPIIGLAKEYEKIYLPNDPVPKRFDKNTQMMLLLRQIRDAAHKFSLGYNIKRRQMSMRNTFKPKKQNL